MVLFLQENVYLLPLICAMFVALLGYASYAPRKVKTNEGVELVYDKLDSSFDNYISNFINELSYKAPFTWFIPEDPTSEKAAALDSTISKAGYSNKMNYRVLQTAQFILLAIALIVTLFLSVFVDNAKLLIKFLFNVEVTGGATSFLLIGAVMIMLAFVPRLVIKTKADSNHTKFIGDLPVLQLFIILMIRSNRTIPEVFYVLSKSDMRYKDIFAHAYRIYLRDRKDAFDYLRNVFYKTPFVDSLTILETFDEYSREESVKVLDNQLTNIVDEVATLKKNKNVLLGLITEGSVALPFMAIMLLGIVPVLMYGLNNMSSATNEATNMAQSLE